MAQRMGWGYVVVNQGQQIVAINPAALRILEREEQPCASSPLRHQHALQKLLERGKIRFPIGTLAWIATSLNRSFTATLDQVRDFTSDPVSVALLLDLDAFPTPNPETLRQLFGLTSAEARLAVHLAQGRTTDEIAAILRVCPTTVRSQLAAVFAKTQTNRQAALVALLARVAVLP